MINEATRSHPAAAMDFEDLLSALRDRVATKLVREVRAPYDDDLALFCYTQTAVVERAWDPIVEMARGLVLDLHLKEVIAKPFPKFFNFGERSATVPYEPFEVTEKLDGSLGIVFFDKRANTWRVATKGSFSSPQALRGAQMLEKLRTSMLQRDVTYLFEVIYPENRIVVRYPFEGLVLLAAYGDHGELSREKLEEHASDMGAKVVGKCDYGSMREMVEACATFASDTEGFVVRFSSGLRLKIKGAEYLRVHRMISNVTPLAIWDGLRNRQDLDLVRKEIPEEFWSDFDTIRALLLAKFNTIVGAVNEALPAFAAMSDKELGLGLENVDAAVRPYVFAARKKGETWPEDSKSWASIWRSIRPSYNALDGYQPSLGILSAQNDA